VQEVLVVSRLMSVAFTEQAVVERRKTVTRRKGWLFVKPGDRLTLCRKVMGRKRRGRGHQRSALCAVAGPYATDQNGGTIWPELIAEGFPDMNPSEFMIRYFINAQGIGAMDDVTRIEWRYLDEEVDRG